MLNIKTLFLAIAIIVFFNFYKSDTIDEDDIFPLPIENVKILAFGDSLTYGTGADKNESYPSVLSRILEVEVINAGVPGETSKKGLRRLPSLLKKYKPNILIICHGGNDFIRSLDKLRTKSNIEKMIDLALKKEISVVLVGVPSFGLFDFTTDKIYYQIAQEYPIEFEDKSLEKILNDDKLKSDQVHPNAKGYKIMAKMIAKIILDSYTSQ